MKEETRVQNRVGIIGMAVIALALVVMVAGSGFAQKKIVVAGDPSLLKITEDMRGEIIDSISQALNEIYVFPEVAKKMEKTMRDNLKKGKYKDTETIDEFAEMLSRDLLDISHDKHLRVRYMTPEEAAEPERMSQEDVSDEDIAKQREMQRRRAAASNFGFKKLEILPGNIGYLKLDGFNDAEFAGPTAVAAMNFLANCEAIIFDLRENGGGSPSMIQLLTSYFLEEPTHINSFYVRAEDSINQFWTLPYVPGPKMTGTDLYVLTSNYTFSAAEEFTYNMKNLKRATIVGETTGGGAHPVTRGVFPNLNIAMSLPFGRAINPISGTNWEGTGVTPDIETSRDNALTAAHLEALKTLKENTTDPDRLAVIQWGITGLEAAMNPVTLDEETARSYTGAYGPRKITYDNGVLYYQREDRPRQELLPLTKTIFHMDGVGYFRLEFVLDDSGKAVKVVGHYDNGHTDENNRTGDA